MKGSTTTHQGAEQPHSIKVAVKFFLFALAALIASTHAYSAECGGSKPSPPFSEVAKGGFEVRIADIAWSTNIINLCPRNRLSGTIDTPNRLYLWMRLQGGDAAINKLKREGRYPLKHVWEVSLGGTILPDPGDEEDIKTVFQQTDNINVTRKLPMQTKALKGEAKSKGTFDWRTWSGKKNLYPGGLYEVKILDQQNRPVPCSQQLHCDPCEGGIRCAVFIKLQ